MTEINAEMVKQLREVTNVSMMECKKALVEANGDMNKAMRLLRERGVAIAAKKAARVTNQGLIASFVSPDGKSASLVEVNCETDFVARNAIFQAFVQEIARKAVQTDEQLSIIMKDDVVMKITEIGENIAIRRNTRYMLQGTGALGSYIHLGGKLGVLLEAGCSKTETTTHPAFKEFVKDITLQIAASRPQYKEPADVPPEVIKAEREIYAKQVQNKPPQVVEKIVNGKINKYYQEICLLLQPFVKDPKQTVSQVKEAIEKIISDSIIIKRFTVYQLGG